MFTLAKFLPIITRLNSTNDFCVAYSGGLDSQVLLHSLLSLKQQFHWSASLRAIHIHHGLSPNADSWAAHCQQFCQALEIPLLIQRVQVETTNKSPEDAARIARYDALQKLLHENEILVTAHTENDQAETVLLQLLRGAGTKGLAAMPEKIVFANSYLLRPLIHFTRDELLAYALQNKLTWIEDESNLNNQYNRNYLRNAILPLLKQRWPKATHTISRAAKNCADASMLTDELAATDLASIALEKNILAINALLKLSDNRQRNIIRFWLQQLNLPLPTTSKLKQLQQDVLHCRPDARPLVHWQGVEIRRFGNGLYAMPPLLKHDPQLIIPWDLQQDLILPNQLGVISLNALTELGLDITKLNNITVRFRQGGERCKLKNRQGSHLLKKLFQEWQVPPWSRDRVPLLYQCDVLIAVIGYGVCDLNRLELV